MRFTRLALVASAVLGGTSCLPDSGAEQAGATLVAGSSLKGCTVPVLGAVSPIVVGCSPLEQTLVPPSVAGCSPVTVSAVLLSVENGTVVVRPLVDSVLPAGVSSGVVRWTATDGAGHSAFVDAVIDASGAVLRAGQSLALGDRAQVLDSAGVPTSVSSAGGVSVGVQALVGNIDSGGDVSLQDRAHVFGPITTAGTVSKQNLVTIDGPVVEHGSPALGPAPSVPSLGQLPSTWTTIEPDRTVTLSAGTHDNVRVPSGASLRLAPGRHVFASLSMEAEAKLVTSEALADIVVAGDFALRGAIEPDAGSWVQLTLLGDGTYTFETNFAGTVIAPNASVALGAGHQVSFVGSYYARNIEIRPDVIVRCPL